MQILVIDDSFEMLEMLVGMLESPQYELFIACAPRMALGLMKNQAFDLVITDYHMQNMNGLQLIQEMRRLQYSSSTILFSGELQQSGELEETLLLLGNVKMVPNKDFMKLAQLVGQFVTTQKLI